MSALSATISTMFAAATFAVMSASMVFSMLFFMAFTLFVLVFVVFSTLFAFAHFALLALFTVAHFALFALTIFLFNGVDFGFGSINFSSVCIVDALFLFFFLLYLFL